MWCGFHGGVDKSAFQMKVSELRRDLGDRGRGGSGGVGGGAPTVSADVDGSQRTQNRSLGVFTFSHFRMCSSDTVTFLLYSASYMMACVTRDQTQHTTLVVLYELVS